MNRPVACSSVISRIAASGPAGRRMKRSILPGMRMSAFIGLPSEIRASCSATVNPRLGMNGKGCAGSIASGVSNGKILWRKWSSIQLRSVLVTSRPSTSTMPTSARIPRRSRQIACWSVVSFETVSLIRTSCSEGVRPSGLRSVMPSRTWALMPATRTMKNSSRLLAEIDRNRTRSSAGWPGLTDSSNTRRLKCSQESSRLMKRSGLRAIARPALGFRIFFFNYNGLRGFHEVTVHPMAASCAIFARAAQSMCYRDDVSMTLMFPPRASSSRKRALRDQLLRSNSAASARVTGRPSRKASLSRSSTACRAAAKDRSIRVAR